MTDVKGTLADFMARRLPSAAQFYAQGEGEARGTIAIASHIWWTELIAYSAYAMGYNVLLMQPLYILYTDEKAWGLFDALYDKYLSEFRKYGVELIIAGNSTAIVPHPKTGKLLHEAAGVPLVNYWWDEPRTCPPYARRLGMGPGDFLKHLKSPRTLNAIWDIDVLEELAAFYGITNTLHVPLATLPGYWPQRRIPLKHRPLMSCFLGNCHFVADYADTSEDPLVKWANKVVAGKLADLDRPMTACLQEAGAAPGGGEDWGTAFRHWEVLNAVYMHRTRNVIVDAAHKHLHGGFALIGHGWEKMGLRANGAHAEANTGHVYASAKTSLNLFGGCVHGGMPLRPFDIAASWGMVLTHYNRELPGLFEVGKECLAFRDREELLGLLDAVESDPGRFEGVVEAGHRRVFAEHTWENRIARIMAAAGEKWGVGKMGS